MIPAPHGTCVGCETPLLQPSGFHGTDLCGPCCTGESATLGQVTYHCTDPACIGCDETKPLTEPPACQRCGAPMELSK